MNAQLSTALGLVVAAILATSTAFAQEKPFQYVVPEIVEDPLIHELPESKDDIFELKFAELLPPGEEVIIAEQRAMMFAGNIAEGSAEDIAVQIGTFNTVDILDGQKIRISGFTVPLAFRKNAKIGEFLLAPYKGACLHQPPPPPNQTIYVTLDKPIQLRDLHSMVTLEGYLRTQRSDTELASAAYTISVTHMEKAKR